MDTSKQNVSKDLPVALILGTGLCALGTIRSLKEDEDISIIVMGNEDKGLAQHSKYIDAYYPCKEDDLNDIYAVLKKINDFYQNVIPIPTGADFWVNVIINAPIKLDHFITDLKPEYSELMKKNVQQKLAEKTKIPYPPSCRVHSREDLNKACESLIFPCVVKPVSRVDRKAPFRIRSYKKANALFKDIEPLLGTYDFLVSTHIMGPDKNIYTYGSFAVDGIVKAHYTGRKLTQRPMKFGVAGFAESIKDIKTVSEYSKRLLNESNFSGISQIEFKKDKETGKYYLMEINPRIWLWIQTATASGVNLVLAYYDHLAKRPPKTHQQSKKCMFINGLSMFDNSFREKNLTWLFYYIKSRFVPHIYSIKDRKDPKPYKIERQRFYKKIIH
ncbi:MAG: ATP-grasp domain-containing protein [Candidatus Neomarinimicrobiota bacterium]|jgi:predicted ATP-grasp superfamily ATP-dependent carboligase